MFNMCSAELAKNLRDLYIKEIERQMKKIQKNFNDMDFENADTRNEFEKIVKKMKTNCRNLINEMNSYRFL